MASGKYQESSFSLFSNCKYQMFLTFRGEDTRKNFTDHLYTALVQAGIHTFRDDDEIGDKLARIVTEMNKKQIEVEKDAAVMQRKKKMFMCIIHCLHSQHCYIHFISIEGEKLGYVFYSTVTEFINCLHY
uniref:TIR domain-containing protein n=1 Tax=Populus trichocarpa TaxID=3694 RepID=A0A2K1R808_POPTR